jgi:hypothetical protein
MCSESKVLKIHFTVGFLAMMQTNTGSIAKSKLLDYLFERIIETIQAIPLEIASDIYVLSCVIPIDGSVSPLPHFEFGYNTHTQRLACTPKLGQESVGNHVASSAGEAKWNYAFWLHDSYISFLDESTDPIGTRLCRAWIESENLDSIKGWELLWPLVTELAKRLNTSGIITAKFGQFLPIIVHDIAMSGDAVIPTEQANPEGQASEFLAGW